MTPLEKIMEKDKQAVDKRILDVSRIRLDFPILSEKAHGKSLVYLDNAATTQKPQRVIDSIRDYYLQSNSNVHRGVHYLSEKATAAYESARVRIQKFIHASKAHEIIFVRGATEGINLVAQTFGKTRVHSGDEIVISAMEHHSNIVPWQILCEQVGAHLRVIPINDSGELIWDEYEKLLTERTRLVAVTHMSNALGTINPVKRIIESAHLRRIPVLVDGAQAVPHQNVNVQDLDCDFYVFSGHKMYGPTGIGVLYGKENLLELMPPYQSGGEMIRSVTFEKTTYNGLPGRFEAGTPNIEGSVGLGTAVDYLSEIGMTNISNYESELLQYGTEVLQGIEGVRLIGTAKEKSGILSFVVDNIHAHDLGTILDWEGVAIRAGHHCAMPVMQRFNVSATARASLAFYNTKEELDVLAHGIRQAKEMFK